MGTEVTRRQAVRTGAVLSLLALASPTRVEALVGETVRARGAGRFLSALELGTLRVVCDRLLPGPPRDPGPGALEAHAPEAIDLLLAAFTFDPPLIHAGGPFSGRAGGARDDFVHFESLDRQAELGWRIRLEGSRGRRSREFAGPVVGYQEIYRTGLARLDVLARRRGAASFATASAPMQDTLLDLEHDSVVKRMADLALVQTLEATLGPPEYRGNRDLVAWRQLRWAGDRQPRGWSDAEVTQVDP